MWLQTGNVTEFTWLQSEPVLHHQESTFMLQSKTSQNKYLDGPNLTGNFSSFSSFATHVGNMHTCIQIRIQPKSRLFLIRVVPITMATSSWKQFEVRTVPKSWVWKIVWYQRIPQSVGDGTSRWETWSVSVTCIGFRSACLTMNKNRRWQC